MDNGKMKMLLASVALGALLHAQALAQEDQSASAAADEEELDGDVITVTGIRSSLRSAAAQKREADQVVDTVTSEDIGKFPTENVADAVQRITGVQITRIRGAGAAASIRGLPPTFTRVELNGSAIASGLGDLDGGISRSFDFRTLPTDFVRTLEVTKSPTADMQEGGLAGTINVETIRPLDLGRTTVTASAMAVENMNSGEITPRVSGLASTTLLDGRLGILVAGGFDKTITETHNNQLDAWNTQAESAFNIDFNSDGDLSDTFNIPAQVRTEILEEQRERTTFAGIVEYEATDGLKIFGEGFYSNLELLVHDMQNLHIFSFATGPVYDPSTTQFTTIPGIDPSQLTAGVPFATTIGLSGTDTRALDRVYNPESDTWYAKGGFEYEGERWAGGLSYQYSDSHQIGDGLGMPQIARFEVTANCEAGNEICGMTFSPETEARYTEPGQGILASINGPFGRENKDQVTEFRGDIERQFDSVISSVSAGFTASQREVFYKTPQLVVPAAAVASVLGLDPSPVQPAGFSIEPYTMLVTAGQGDYLDAYDGPISFPTAWLSSDTSRAIDEIGRDNLPGLGFVNENLNQNIDLEEDIFAGYAMMNFGLPGDMVTGNVGLRVVETTSTSSGFSPDLTQIRVLVDAGGVVTAPAAGEISEEYSYTEFLPSANVRIEATDEVVLRLAASRTMARPNLNQISPTTVLTGVGSNFTISAGNPSLDPFISLNYDFSAEWYPTVDTAVTMALFYKELTTLVRPVTTNVTIPTTFVNEANGTSEVRDQIFLRTEPTNQNGVELKGVELAYQQSFTFLPGLLSYTGFQANYTFIDNSDPQVLTAASKHNFNLSGFYENGGLGLRASYTWRDQFVSTGLPDGYFGLGVTTRERGNLDLSASYDFTENVSVVLEGTNVLNGVDDTETTLGGLPFSYFDPGAQYLAGVRVTF